MKVSILLGAFLTSLASAAVLRARNGTSSANPFEGKTQFQSPEYADLVGISAQLFLGDSEPELAAQAKQIIAQNPTWTWL
jgi:hypothetical protein